MATRTQRIQCILPPHVLTQIEERGTPAQREIASRMIGLSDQVRRDRVAVLGGMAAHAVPAPTAGKQRFVYDGRHGVGLPGDSVRVEGDPPTGDPAVDEAYDGSGATYDLYRNVYGRDSIDGQGMRLDSTVHHL